MRSPCEDKTARHAAIAAETARLKRAWAMLKLETMDKREWTENEFRALAAYMCTRAGPNSDYAHTPDIVEKLPIKLATVKTASRKKLLAIANKTSPYHSGMSIQNFSKDSALRPLALDYRKLATFVTQRPPGSLTWSYGIFHNPKNPGFHSDDANGTGAPIIIGRINLPTEFRRADGSVFQADNNSVYVLAGTYIERVPDDTPRYHEGTMHQSCAVSQPTPSIFMRVFCR